MVCIKIIIGAYKNDYYSFQKNITKLHKNNKNLISFVL